MPTHTTVSSRGAALVTGGATRIGAVIANRLAQAGFAVVVHYRKSRGDADATVAAIKAAGGQAAAVRTDLADRAERAALIGLAGEPFGPLSLLVNSASEYEPDSLFSLTEEWWDANFAVHAEAPVFLARDFAAQLPADTKGNIVNIIDSRVLAPSPSYFSYMLSKATLWTATRMLAQTLAPQIRVNAVGPGPMWVQDHRNEAAFNKMIRGLPLGISPMADDVATAVLTLIDMPATTGQLLTLDGGEHIEFAARHAPLPKKP